MTAGRAPNISPEIKGITSFTVWPGGGLYECRVDKENHIKTPFGTFVPRYSRPDIRSRESKSLTFHKNGRVASIYLEMQTTVKTPAGIIEAELITFHEDGSLNSVFPLNGQIGFGWSEEDEGKRAPRHTFTLNVGTISVKLNGIRFYPGGSIKSLIFWPGETAPVKTPAGDFLARIGLRFYEDGSLESFEPALPVTLNTPIGPVLAYNVNALGVDADFNSVRFDTAGNLVHLATAGDIIVNNPNSGRIRISSLTRLGLTDDCMVMLPLSLSFMGEGVRIGNGRDTWEFSPANSQFLLLPDIDRDAGTICGEGCAACRGYGALSC